MGEVKDWNPRYLYYVASQGDRTPEAQMEHDRVEYPGGRMCGFILWISGRRQKFLREHPEAFIGFGISDQPLWDSFLKAESSSVSVVSSDGRGVGG
jgi:hypothetical protein